MGKKKTAEGHRYVYTMCVTEMVRSKCVIRSGRKMTYDQLERLAEKRRVAGKLTCTGVPDVDIWCENASMDGVDFNEYTEDLIARE